MDAGADDRFALLRKYETAANSAVVRRYFAADKFDDLANTGKLFFSPASKMADKEEGYFTGADQRARELQLSGFTGREMNIARQAWDSVSAGNAKAVVLSCWSLGEDETRKLWSEYGQSEEAVAIETTVAGLREALGSGFLYVPVQYVDRDTRLLPTDHSLEPFFFKDHEYEWERELRVVGEMEIGRRLCTPRRVAIDSHAQVFTFVTAPGAPRTRYEEVHARMQARFSRSRLRASSVCAA